MVLAAFTIPPLAEAMALFAATLLLGAFVFYLAKRGLPAMRSAFSDGPTGEEASAMLSQFRDLHDRGGLSSGEFQHIKSKLGPQAQLETGEESAAQLLADGKDTLRDAARYAAQKLAESKADQATGGDSDAQDERAAGPDKLDVSEADGRTAGEGCDVPPHDGGDSMEESR